MSNGPTDTSRPEEIWFDRDGATLFAVQSGEGFPVILLHGGLANHLACRVFATPLSRRFRLITPDLRASGRSIHAGHAGHASPLTWNQLADDVAALMRHLGLPRAAIGGISAGAGCAVRVALRHPALTAALIVLTPAFAGADAGLTPAQQGAMRAMDAAGTRAVAEGVQVLLPLFDALPPEVRARARAVVAGYDPASVAATTRFLASGAQPFATAADLAAISAPTLLVPGTDPYHPPGVSDRYRRHLPRCTVREVDPPGYAAAIAEFLDQQQLV
ncbi:MAG TPA: alpha/beta hydrolase [Kofleriaceae bacterium]